METAILFAKIDALLTSFEKISYTPHNEILGNQVVHLFKLFQEFTAQIKEVLPDLYADLPTIQILKGKISGHGKFYNRQEIDAIPNQLRYILEIRSSSRIGEAAVEKPKRVFISHGHTQEWYKVQAFIEKDMKIPTLELAQEAHTGRTILQKLAEESSKCNYAVIIMTSDDEIPDENPRARQNVIHEIGCFQGKYGLRNICALQIK